MRKLAIGLLLALTGCLGNAQGWPVYSFTTSTITPLPGPNVLRISCHPYRTEGGIGAVLLMCTVQAEKGYPAFYPTAMTYVVDGFQYDVSRDSVQFLGGMSAGNIHEGATIVFRWAPEFLLWTSPIDIYYGPSGVRIPLPDLLAGQWTDDAEVAPESKD